MSKTPLFLTSLVLAAAYSPSGPYTQRGRENWDAELLDIIFTTSFPTDSPPPLRRSLRKTKKRRRQVRQLAPTLMPPVPRGSRI